jgi:hypothetical protein
MAVEREKRTSRAMIDIDEHDDEGRCSTDGRRGKPGAVT